MRGRRYPEEALDSLQLDDILRRLRARVVADNGRRPDSMLAAVVIATDREDEPMVFDYFRPGMAPDSFILRFAAGAVWRTAKAYSHAITAALRGTSSPFILVTYDFALPALDLARRVVQAVTAEGMRASGAPPPAPTGQVGKGWSFVALLNGHTRPDASWYALNTVDKSCLKAACGMGLVFRYELCRGQAPVPQTAATLFPKVNQHLR